MKLSLDPIATITETKAIPYEDGRLNLRMYSGDDLWAELMLTSEERTEMALLLTANYQPPSDADPIRSTPVNPLRSYIIYVAHELAYDYVGDDSSLLKGLLEETLTAMTPAQKDRAQTIETLLRRLFSSFPPAEQE